MADMKTPTATAAVTTAPAAPVETAIADVTGATPSVTADPVPDIVSQAFQYKQIREQAIAYLLKQQSAIAAKLADLGYNLPPDPAHTKPATKNPCRVCGSTEHDARSHRGETPAQRAKYKKVMKG